MPSLLRADIRPDCEDTATNAQLTETRQIPPNRATIAYERRSSAGSRVAYATPIGVYTAANTFSRSAQTVPIDIDNTVLHGAGLDVPPRPYAAIFRDQVVEVGRGSIGLVIFEKEIPCRAVGREFIEDIIFQKEIPCRHGDRADTTRGPAGCMPSTLTQAVDSYIITTDRRHR